MSAYKKTLMFVLCGLLFVPVFLSLTGNTCGADDYTWTGNSSDDWSDLNNWLPIGMMPSSTDKAIIPGGAPNYPRITDYRPVGELLVEENAYLLISSSTGSLQIFGTAEINGSLTLSEGSFHISTDGTCTVNGLLKLDAGIFYFGHNASMLNNATIDWSGGEIRPLSVNTFILNNSGEMNITTGGIKKLTACVLTNNGTINLSDTVEVSSSTGITGITNKNILNWIAGGFVIPPLSLPSPPFLLTNNAEINISTANPKSLSYCTFTNEFDGNVNINNAALSVSGNENSRFENKGHLMGNGTLNFIPPSPPDLAMPPFRNSGIIKPGGLDAVGKLIIKGKYEQVA
ncbi:MAG: hypothetical protein BWK80_20990, partial [Desulfobacteraceae bacterium IS3]